MIEIDGSYGEGGGQILRTSVSLSALTLKPVRITKIRAGRPQPGLKRQHLAGIELVAQLVNAETKGLEVGSTQIEFIPTDLQSGDFEYDIGTAGAISLVLQAVLPPAILSQEPVRFRIKGGTDVSWSPPVDYLSEVFVPMIAQMGPKIEIHQNKRGHYPRGGGSVSVEVHPTSEISTITLVDFGEIASVTGVSHCVRLPDHVADRQASAAEYEIENKELNLEPIRREWYPKSNDPHLGAGSGIVLWAESKSGIRIGATGLGERGKRAEQVGKEAAQYLLQELATKRAVDKHLSDMLIPYLALANGESKIGVTEITSHLVTNIWVAKKVLGAEIEVQGNIGEPGIASVRGIGFSLLE
ncbi:MAG: RNA 3'-terminal phosphate cyclase [Candidatus Thorarchaeota archaeon]|nr:RNA 3'-terminal phosphate cyclase [Candidatus Thorarchaeota archaeon]